MILQEELLEKIASDISEDWGVSGLYEGIHKDFVNEIMIRYAMQSKPIGILSFPELSNDELNTLRTAFNALFSIIFGLGFIIQSIINYKNVSL